MNPSYAELIMELEGFVTNPRVLGILENLAESRAIVQRGTLGLPIDANSDNYKLHVAILKYQTMYQEVQSYKARGVE